EMNVRGVTSATVFKSASDKSYVLCTTSPSRETHMGEMSFISPIASRPMNVPPQLHRSLWNLKKAKAMIAGAVSPMGHTIALIEETGRIVLMHLSPQNCGGLEELSPVTLDQKLVRQRYTSPTSVRFCESNQQLYLVAIDTDGTVIKKRLEIG
ncbi:hypothetical protein MMC13_001859, partial [Lambiella insularis]|nr:hypothetical protein [Lambiella insularis]